MFEEQLFWHTLESKIIIYSAVNNRKVFSNSIFSFRTDDASATQLLLFPLDAYVWKTTAAWLLCWDGCLWQSYSATSIWIGIFQICCSGSAIKIIARETSPNRPSYQLFFFYFDCFVVESICCSYPDVSMKIELYKSVKWYIWTTLRRHTYTNAPYDIFVWGSP